LGPVLPVFIELYLDVKIDLTATNKTVDIVGDGHDAESFLAAPLQKT
jgi:hypothetical protein